jgi:hypothetical protein
MSNKSNKFLVITVITLFCFIGCNNNHFEKENDHPAVVEDIQGTNLSSVTLTDKAIDRIGLQTAEVKEEHGSPLRLVVPYSSIIYDPTGQVWVYTSSKPQTFIRHKVDVDHIEGDKVFLKSGPPKGTVVATVGTAELYGTEMKIGH